MIKIFKVFHKITTKELTQGPHIPEWVKWLATIDEF